MSFETARLQTLSQQLNTARHPIEKVISTLTIVFKEHIDWSDNLTTAIFCWSHDVIAIDFASLAVKEGINKVKNAAQLLLEKVMVDGIWQKPLQNPVLERQWTWDRTVLENYRAQRSTLSPFDGKPMDANVRVHTFAIALRLWTKDICGCPQAIIVYPLSQAIEEYDAATAQKKIGQFIQLAQMSRQIIVAKQMQLTMKRVTAECVLQTTKYNEQTAVITAANTEVALAFAAKKEQLFTMLTEQHEQVKQQQRIYDACLLKQLNEKQHATETLQKTAGDYDCKINELSVRLPANR